MQSRKISVDEYRWFKEESESKGEREAGGEALGAQVQVQAARALRSRHGATLN